MYLAYECKMNVKIQEPIGQYENHNQNTHKHIYKNIHYINHHGDIRVCMITVCCTMVIYVYLFYYH